MSRSTAPPPRWQRLTLGFAPVAGLSVLLVSNTAVEMALNTSSVVNVLLLVMTGAGLIPAVVFAKGVWAAERVVTDEMRSRYETLRGLLESGSCTDAPLVNVHDGVVILGVDELGRWTRDREFIRFAPRTDTTAADGSQYRVYERFTLQDTRPVVLHRADALSVKTDPDGEAHLAHLPCPSQATRPRMSTRRMTTRTGVDVATIPDLDQLIEQIRTASANPTQ